jgi:formylglycine-generating enzyme required for sulfatase activity
MDFVLVPRGKFWMGGGGGKAGDKEVTTPHDFYLGAYPVTQEQWLKEFLQKLNGTERQSGWTYRLPTEAEWEYACRGAPLTKEACGFDFYLAAATNDLSSNAANFNGTSPAGKGNKGPYLERPTRVGSYQPNRLGLYDMHGNVWEWCDDLYGSGSSRVYRGGWSSFGSFPLSR